MTLSLPERKVLWEIVYDISGNETAILGITGSQSLRLAKKIQDQQTELTIANATIVELREKLDKTMARPFRELRNRMSPEAQERAERLANEDLLELNLQERERRMGR